MRAREYLGHMLDAVGQIQEYSQGKIAEDLEAAIAVPDNPLS